MMPNNLQPGQGVALPQGPGAQGVGLMMPMQQFPQMGNGFVPDMRGHGLQGLSTPMDGSGMGFFPNQGMSGMPAQNAANPGSYLPAGGVMSNGAPVLIRGNGRDWNNNQQSMIGVSCYILPCVVNNITGQR
jgi:hypothetical protein